MEILQKNQMYGEQESDSGKRLPARNSCSRCGGMMILTFCISPDQGNWDFEIPVGRCLQCGDIIDPTILKHRDQSHAVRSTI